MAEKFTRWNEPKSGINPFVPPRRRSPGNFVGKALKVVVGSVIALLRLPILLVLFVLLAIAGLLAKLMPIRALSRLMKFLLESPLCYLCLMFLGFYNLQATTIDRRRVHLPEDKKNGRGARPASGDIIVASNTCFAELLYAGYKYCPVFVRSSIKGGLQEVTLVTMLVNSFSPVPESLPEGCTVEAALKAARGALGGPLFFQAEVARSNGRGVLSFGAAASEVGRVVAKMPAQQRPSLHTLVFRYPAKYFIPTHTANKALGHLWWTCSQVYNNLHAVSLPATFDPQPSGDGTAWAAASRNALVEALGTGARSVDFDARDFNEFFEAFRNPDTRTKKRVRTYHGDQPAGAAVGRTDKKKQ